MAVDAARAALIASLALGAADALLACWANRAVAPRSTLPLCLTAPFGISLLVLAPLACVVALATTLRSAWRGRPHEADAGGLRIAAIVAVLLAAIAGAATLRSLGALATAWQEAGEGALAASARLVALPVAAVVAWPTLRVARRLLARATAARLGRLAAIAAVIHLAALSGAVHQLRREGRGVVRDAVLGSLAAGAARLARPANASAAAREGLPPRSLVLVTIDTLRADHLDGARMPHAATFASRAVRFRAAFAASSWTLPALASLLTGLPPWRHGAGLPTGDDPLARSPLAPGVPTLATRLARAGFRTQAIVTNPYLALGYGLGRGFEGFENVTLESEAVLTLRPTLGFWLLERVVPALAIADRGGAVTRRAARYLAGRRPGERFFLWLHYVDPHAPYDGATRSFRGDLLAGIEARGALPRMAQLRAGEIRPGPAGRRAIRDAYARAVRDVDAEVGEVLALLVRRGLGAETLVVVAADHGEELWDHGGVEHGHTLYDELIRVPLVIGCPSPGPGTGCPAAAEIAAPVGVDGLAATLLELLGVAPAVPSSPPPGASPRAGAPAAPDAGMSPGFTALLRGGRHVPRPVASANLLFAEERVSLRTRRFTYVAWPNGKEELYDRRRDPGELHDLAARRRVVARHRRALARLQTLPTGGRTTPALGVAPARAARSTPVAAPAGAAAPEEPPGAAPAIRRALRTLGYVE